MQDVQMNQVATIGRSRPLVKSLVSINQTFNEKGELINIYPLPPEYNPQCPVNTDYDTLPVGFPMRSTSLGPNSSKHLYRDPWYYPTQRQSIPDNSLYGFDSSKFGPFGRRITYGAKLYPYQQRSPREVREYSETLLPMPNLFEWTRYHTISDGAWGR